MTDAKRIRRARELAGLSTTQASRLLGIEVARLSDVESGRVTPDDAEVRSMADRYGTPEPWLRGAPAIAPAHVIKMLDDADIEGNDRAVIVEFAGMLASKPKPKPTTSVSVEGKRRYVKRQGQTRKHHCHWPGCDAQVPPAMWGCKAHWFKLPKALRDRIWATYQPGQEVDMTPSSDYLDVADEVQNWIKANGSAGR